jgi:acyl-CoA synthetase (AMP-forming)/AMP-acid ligase II/thioesterase domain-containing protein
LAACATCAPLNPAYKFDEFDFYLSDLKAKAVIVPFGTDSPVIDIAQKQNIPLITLSPVLEAEAGIFTLECQEQSRPKYGGFAQSTDIALALHTSGTTSRPKLVPLTQASICASTYNSIAALGLSSGDRCLNTMPLFHIHGLMVILSSLAAGASVICTCKPDLSDFFMCMEDFRPSWYTASPTIHQAILAQAKWNREIIRRCPLRFIRSSASPLTAKVMTELETTFNAPVIESYAMTEASYQISSNPFPPAKRKIGSVGVPAGPEVGVMDDLGNLLPRTKTGEIVIRGPNVMQGYENNSAANMMSFVDGWFRTGDQAYFDADGYLFITGRLKEIINRGGEKISPREVDEVLLEHPAVSEAVTFSIPHVTLGEEVAAAVVLREQVSATETEIRDFVAARLSEFKVPRRILILDKIPKGATGKLQRLEMAEKLGLTRRGDSEARRTFVGPRDRLELRLIRIWEQIFGLMSIGVLDDFFDLGGHSLLAVRLLMRVQKEFNRSIPLGALFARPTVAKLADLLRQGGKPLQWNWLMPFRSVGSKPPLFLLHGSGELGRQIDVDGDQPVYGVRPHGLDGRRMPLSVEQMAAEYVQEIRTFQLEGPYFIAGFSFGGLVAFEVARQLQEQGQQVAILILVDPTRPNYGHSKPAVCSNRFRVGATRLRRLWIQQMAAGLQEKIREKFYSVEMLLCHALLSIGRRVPVRLRVFYYRQMNFQIASNYVASVYPGRVVLLLTRSNAENVSDWNQLVTGGLEIYEMPGQHLDAIGGPLVKAWAERLRACLQDAQTQFAVQSETGRQG